MKRMGTFARTICAAAALACVCLAGCGAKATDPVPVRGKVTLGGGPWPKPGTLNFTPSAAAAGAPSRPGSADFDAEGNFTAMTIQPGDGLLPGKYRVTVTCWEVPPQMNNPAAARSAVPPKYQQAETSGLEVNVEPGKPQTDLKLDVPKS